MNIDRIGYRFARDEMSALRMLLNLPCPPGMRFPVLSEADFRSACARLQSSGLLTPLGQRAGIDCLSALLLTAASRCQAWLCVEAGSATLAIWQGERLFVAGYLPEAGPCELTPLQNRETAEGFLFETVSRLPLPATVVGSGLTPQTIETWSALPELARQTLN